VLSSRHARFLIAAKGHLLPYKKREGDSLLIEALEKGVPAVILSPETPRQDRKFISEVLNSAFHFRWVVSNDGKGTLSITTDLKAAEVDQLEALSKTLDAYELGELVKQQMKIDASKEKDDPKRKSKL